MSTVINKAQARQNLAAALTRLMAEHDVKQADIAKAIRSPDEDLQNARQRVYRYCSGLSDSFGTDLANIAEFFGVSVDVLLNGTRRKKSRRAG